jgi:colanic acid/amylovoran biosynthesis glycosyltransferase
MRVGLRNKQLSQLEVAYILLRFPHLTETFVADEIWALQQQGVCVTIYSLLEPRPGLVQPTSERLAEDTHYAPGLLSWSLWCAQLYFLTTVPIKYLTLFIHLMQRPYPRPFLAYFLRRLLIFGKATALALTLRNTSTNLIHAHFAWLSGAAARVISGLLDIPYTITVHAYDIYASRDLLCFSAHSASHIVAISEYNKQMVLDLCPDIAEDSISVIHCGINLDLFVPQPKSEREGPLSILSIGSLIEKKGHKYLIRSCHELKGRGMDFRCTIIGRGPAEHSLRQLVRDLDLEDTVVLAGARQQDEVLDAYRNSDLFVLACVVGKGGDRDGIPVVLMEALAMQVPVISTQVSGLPELVGHQSTGWLVPERDAAAITTAIVHLANDKKLRTDLAYEGRILVENEFEIRGNVSKLVGIFQHAVAQDSKKNGSPMG